MLALLVLAITTTTNYVDAYDTLHWAALKNDYVTIGKYLGDINEKTPFGESALHVAVHWYNVDVIQTLLSHADIDVNVQNDHGDTPLHRAVEQGLHDVVQLLLTHTNINANMKNHFGYTPLHFAVSCHHSNRLVLQNLLTYEHINVSVQDNHRNDTALHMAVRYINADIVQQLLNVKDIDIDIKNAMRFTAMDYAQHLCPRNTLPRDNNMKTKLYKAYLFITTGNMYADMPVWKQRCRFIMESLQDGCVASASMKAKLRNAFQYLNLIK